MTGSAPAIRLAEEGFPVSYALSESLKAAAPLLSRFPESRRIFLRNGNYFEEGEILVQKELGATLRLISELGAPGFYEGRVAAACSGPPATTTCGNRWSAREWQAHIRST